MGNTTQSSTCWTESAISEKHFERAGLIRNARHVIEADATRVLRQYHEEEALTAPLQRREFETYSRLAEEAINSVFLGDGRLTADIPTVRSPSTNNGGGARPKTHPTRRTSPCYLFRHGYSTRRYSSRHRRFSDHFGPTSTSSVTPSPD